ncbi:MAG TPA: DUF2244 domain-containing protein [Thermohalobaculum sp.]|nr:DUF2244 domain-containing protein [Thermohalobaculum sp.]
MTKVFRSVAGGELPAAAVPGHRLGWRARHDRPVYRALIWPNRPLGLRGKRLALGVAGAGLALPLLAVLGTPVFWGLAPFLAGALGLLWLGLRRSEFDGRLVEEVALWRDEMRVERREPAGRVLRWSADPFHVRLTLHAQGRVENYLTLGGGGREIELGAFLSPEERVALAAELEAALTRAIRL